MEIVRRGILLAGVGLALWMAYFAVLTPLVSVRSFDFAEAQKSESSWTDEGKTLRDLPLEAYIAEKTTSALRTVRGPAWESFFSGLRAADGGTSGGGDWLRRAPADEVRFRLSPEHFFFRPGESPVSSLAGEWAADRGTVYLALEGSPAPVYLEARYHTYGSDDFRFGSGFSPAPKPPAALIFPFRKFFWGAVFLGLLAYLALPRRKYGKQDVFYPAWRNALGDFAAFLLIVPFFAAPLLIVGGSVQALTRGWMFCAFLWPLALLGVWVLLRIAWYAGYSISPRKDGFLLRTGRLEKMIPYADMDHFGPLELRPPRWLVWASALAAFSGRGGSRTGAAGRAFLLAGSSNGGLEVGFKDGSSVFIWVTDAMGTAALRNAGWMVKGLEAAGIRQVEDAGVIRSVAPPTGRSASGKILKQGSEGAVWILAGLPVAAMIVFLLLALFGLRF